ncbi:MAG: 3-oxoacyl-[acyl-carrier-protein] reductase [bacterium]|nr:3-oxoacyl-[acyl-carrier-protein] reductase [bacterium]
MLKGTVALVTGGSKGIGREICKKLSSQGSHVFVNYNSSPQAAEDTVSQCKELGGIAETLQFDVANSDSVNTAFDVIKSKAGGLDILVNNAGIAKDGLLLRFKDEDWAQTIATNLNGTFYCSRAASKLLLKSKAGRIVNISSVTAEMGNAGQVAYTASKAGIFGLTKTLARELASRGVTVNCITPGFIETEMTGKLTEDTKQSYLKSIPLGRFGSASEVAELVAFLSGPGSSYVTGQIIGISGGLYM